MSIEIFHLAADNCETQVVLELQMMEDTDVNGKTIYNADVLSFYSSKDDDRIEKSIIVACATNNIHESKTNRFGWDFDEQIRPFLKLDKSSPAKCCHLTNYLAKRYNFKLNF